MGRFGAPVSSFRDLDAMPQEVSTLEAFLILALARFCGEC